MTIRLSCVIVCVLLMASCRSIPADRYGVDKLRFEGVKKLDEDALRACLATRERDRIDIGLGTSADSECGVPPFDGNRVHLRLWRWPWKKWPTLDLSVFERDLRRVERWYKARGYYEAKVTGTEFSPAQAAQSDQIDPEQPGCKAEGKGEGCTVAIGISVFEGDPVRVRSIEFEGQEDLSEAKQKKLRKVVELRKGRPFDEAVYELSKKAIRRELEEATHACAKVEGRVELNRDEKHADVRFMVTPGPRSKIGKVKIVGNEDLPARTIRGTAGIESGQAYVASELADAQRAIYALGAFASVNVVGIPQLDMEEACTGVVDVEIRVEPGRRIRYGIGLGAQSGTIETLITDQDARISDLHLFLLFEHRNFLGGLRRLRIEDRPKFIARHPTFRFIRSGFEFGNELKISLRQPAFLEARTILSVNLRHDYGLDPNDLFLRHDFESAISVSRAFWGGRLTISGGINWNEYVVIDRDNPKFPTDHRLLFFNQRVQLDLRDDSRAPRKGFFAELDLQESAFELRKSWQYLRVTPEVRGYLPLPLSSTLALRFGIGAMFIYSASRSLDPQSRVLGPQNYRLRSGGPTSHRGFVPGFLGDPANRSGVAANASPQFDRNSGGLRRWEASAEWRIPVTRDFSTAVFTDLGDVNRAGSFRFRHLNTAVGFGFRYQTPVGPLRFDMGFLIPNAQIVDSKDPKFDFELFGRVPGAFHVTIGEAF